MFKQYTSLVDEEEKHTNLRGLMDFEYPKKGVKLEEVESVDSIVTRFKTGAMSYGSIFLCFDFVKFERIENDKLAFINLCC